MINKHYRKSINKRIGEYNLSITNFGTVYAITTKGNIKLNSVWNPKTRKLLIVLPNDKTVILYAVKDGLKTKKELDILLEEKRMDQNPLVVFVSYIINSVIRGLMKIKLLPRVAK